MAKEYDAQEIVRSLNTEVAEDVQATALAVLRNVVIGTPVGNPTLWQIPIAPPGYVGGHARRNWNVSIGTPSDEVKGVAGKGPGEAGAGQEAIADGSRQIASFNIARRRIIVQNNVPYIVPLNNGHSTQAPVNFVQKAVMAGHNVNRNSRKDVP